MFMYLYNNKEMENGWVWSRAAPETDVCGCDYAYAFKPNIYSVHCNGIFIFIKIFCVVLLI